MSCQSTQCCVPASYAGHSRCARRTGAWSTTMIKIVRLGKRTFIDCGRAISWAIGIEVGRDAATGDSRIALRFAYWYVMASRVSEPKAADMAVLVRMAAALQCLHPVEAADPYAALE